MVELLKTKTFKTFIHIVLSYTFIAVFNAISNVFIVEIKSRA